jgi:hypothetical protein
MDGRVNGGSGVIGQQRKTLPPEGERVCLVRPAFSTIQKALPDFADELTEGGFLLNE